MRLGLCFDCATAESVIEGGIDMYDQEIEFKDGISRAASKVRYIIKLFKLVDNSTNH